MNKLSIEYCVKCRWLIRAAWMAQELLTSFEDELQEVALIPGKTGGVFNITLNEKLIWSRKEQRGFPDISQLKQLVRDKVAPNKELGHTDQVGKV